jgi:hypothetical protein
VTSLRRALDLLGSKRNDAYEAALAALRDDTQGWWNDELARAPDELGECEEPVTADVMGRCRFLEAQVLPWFRKSQEGVGQPAINPRAGVW